MSDTGKYEEEITSISPAEEPTRPGFGAEIRLDFHNLLLPV